MLIEIILHVVKLLGYINENSRNSIIIYIKSEATHETNVIWPGQPQMNFWIRHCIQYRPRPPIKSRRPRFNAILYEKSKMTIENYRNVKLKETQTKVEEGISTSLGK